MDRRVTSPTWGPPPPCKQTLRFSSICTSYGKSINLTFKALSKRDLQVMMFLCDFNTSIDAELLRIEIALESSLLAVRILSEVIIIF